MPHSGRGCLGTKPLNAHLTCVLFPIHCMTTVYEIFFIQPVRYTSHLPCEKLPSHAVWTVSFQITLRNKEHSTVWTNSWLACWKKVLKHFITCSEQAGWKLFNPKELWVSHCSPLSCQLHVLIPSAANLAEFSTQGLIYSISNTKHRDQGSMKAPLQKCYFRIPKIIGSLSWTPWQNSKSSNRKVHNIHSPS